MQLEDQILEKIRRIEERERAFAEPDYSVEEFVNESVSKSINFLINFFGVILVFGTLGVIGAI